MSDICGAKSDPLADGTVLVCDQTDHPFPTHSDDGHAWGDPSLLELVAVPEELVEDFGSVYEADQVIENVNPE
jgi:hypothetical protein